MNRNETSVARGHLDSSLLFEDLELVMDNILQRHLGKMMKRTWADECKPRIVLDRFGKINEGDAGNAQDDTIECLPWIWNPNESNRCLHWEFNPQSLFVHDITGANTLTGSRG